MDDQNKSVNERWAPPASSQERGYATDPGYASGEYASGPSYRGTTAEPETEEATARRTAEIQSEIDRTRADLGETIEAIQDRLAPRNVASRAAESVREATVDRVRDMAHSVHDRMPYRVQEWADRRGPGIVDYVRENPLPAIAAAASLAWLAFSGRRSRSYGAPYDTGASVDRYDSRYEGRYDRDYAAQSSSRKSWQGSSENSRGAGQWNSGDSSYEERSGEATFGRAQQVAAQAGDRVRRTAMDVQQRGRRVASDSPLAAGAIAAAIGLAIGLAIPETERENELMGEARDAVLDRGRDTVRNVAERVQNVAGEVQKVAGEALKNASTSGGEVRGADNP